MPLLEDNQRLTIEHFEKMLMKLLQTHADYQKQISTLTEENKTLKALLEASKTNPQTVKNNTTCDNDLQINKYIKEIDFCLAYFEET